MQPSPQDYLLGDQSMFLTAPRRPHRPSRLTNSIHRATLCKPLGAVWLEVDLCVML